MLNIGHGFRSRISLDVGSMPGPATDEMTDTGHQGVGGRLACLHVEALTAGRIAAMSSCGAVRCRNRPVRLGCAQTW